MIKFTTEIDPLIKGSIIYLNEKKYFTLFSCQDHEETNNSTAYISFDIKKIKKKDLKILLKTLFEIVKNIEKEKKIYQEKGFPNISINDMASIYFKIDRDKINSVVENKSNFNEINKRFWNTFEKQLKLKLK